MRSVAVSGDGNGVGVGGDAGIGTAVGAGIGTEVGAGVGTVVGAYDGVVVSYSVRGTCPAGLDEFFIFLNSMNIHTIEKNGKARTHTGVTAFNLLCDDPPGCCVAGSS